MSQGISGLLVSRGLPQASPDTPLSTSGSIQAARGGKYRDAKIEIVSPNFNALADEGSYFTAANPTMGTPIAYAIQTTFSDTVALLSMRNKAGTLNGPRIYLDFIRLIVGVVPASATSGQYAIKTDFAGAVRPSAGTALTPGSPNTDVTPGSVMELLATPTVAAATPNARVVDRGTVRGTVPIIQDEYLFVFGSVEKAHAVSTGLGTAIRAPIPVPPLVLGPGTNQAAFLHLWFPANAATALSYEISVGWYER